MCLDMACAQCWDPYLGSHTSCGEVSYFNCADADLPEECKPFRCTDTDIDGVISVLIVVNEADNDVFFSCSCHRTSR